LTASGSGTKSSFGPKDWPLVSAQSMNLFSSGALLVLSGTIAQVKVQIG
jgi:hypothetical protein